MWWEPGSTARIEHACSHDGNLVLTFLLLAIASCSLRQWDYDNGVGSKVDRFKIDLYEADGTGDCGTWITSICDKPTIGCKDSSEYHVAVYGSCKEAPSLRRLP